MTGSTSTDHWREYDQALARLADRLSKRGVRALVGVPTGGAIVARDLSRQLGIATLDFRSPSELPRKRLADVWLVDDLVDSGRTAIEWMAADAFAGFDALWRKDVSPPDLAPQAVPVNGWLRLPWEGPHGAEDAVVRLIQHLGEDPNREGLRDTPGRVCRALREMTDGYRADVAAILAKQFKCDHDEMVIVRGIRFTSLCEHHLLPFVGHATVAYLPSGSVVGLSKIPRLVRAHARRLQLQERMTESIARDLMTHLGARGAGVVVRAHHSCMGCRGIEQPDAEMVTSALLGRLRDDPSARAELLALQR